MAILKNLLIFATHSTKLVTVSVFRWIAVSLKRKDMHPDAGLDVTNLIQTHGYDIENHRIITDDGYELELHRIPHGKNNGVDSTDKPVIFVVAGIMCSAADWVNMGPDKGLAYLLAEAGYDVWLGSCRGSKSGRKHVFLDPKKHGKEFFSYSYHEIGFYDLPASIDYILKITHKEKLIFLGHSQATTSFFVLTSEKPEYNDKIEVMVALAPVTYMSNSHSILLRLCAGVSGGLEILSNITGIFEFVPHTCITTSIGHYSHCDPLCILLLYLIAGHNHEQFNKSMLPVILSNFPAGASTKQLWHYAQAIKTGTFRRYDHGPNNVEIYGQDCPPDYNLKNVKAPVALFYAKNDKVSSIKDVERLAEELPNVVKRHVINYKLFTHLDFMWAKDAKTLLYDDILGFLEEFRNNLEIENNS